MTYQDFRRLFFLLLSLGLLLAALAVIHGFFGLLSSIGVQFLHTGLLVSYYSILALSVMALHEYTVYKRSTSIIAIMLFFGFSAFFLTIWRIVNFPLEEVVKFSVYTGYFPALLLILVVFYKQYKSGQISIYKLQKIGILSFFLPLFIAFKPQWLISRKSASVKAGL